MTDTSQVFSFINVALVRASINSHNLAKRKKLNKNIPNIIKMGKKYFIPDLPFIQKHIKGNSKALIVKGETNIVEFNSKEDMDRFIEDIQKSEFVNDKELVSNIKEYLPGVDRFFTEIPIAQPEIINALMFIFNDYPSDLIEDDNILTGLRKFFNHVIKKNEITFLLNNIRNGTLLYDENWKHKIFQKFYFLMKKTAYNLDTYYFFFSNTQYLLRDTVLRELMFSDKVITDKKECILNRVFNICGNNFLNLKKRLVHMKNQIINNQKTLKRTTIIKKLPKKYKEMEKIALKKIDATIEDIDTKIKDCNDCKIRLREEIKRRHGFFSKQTLKRIFKEFKWSRPFTRK